MTLSFTNPPAEIGDDEPVSALRAGGSPGGVAPGYYLQEGAGPALWFHEALFRMKARALDTDGQFNIVEQLTPRGFGAPAHRHEGASESFYVIDGTMDFAVGDTVFTGVSAGGFVYVPRGTRHEFRVVSSTAKFLLFTTPGGLERYFEELGSPAEGNTFPIRPHRDLTVEEVAAAKKRWDALATNDGTLLPPL
jgi:quercetin dioxygenase-like cupin family protein